MKTCFRILLGACLILGGLFYGLNALGLTAVSISLDGWWTLFIIFPALDQIFKKKGDVGSWWLLFLGVLLLLAARNIILYSLAWALALALLIIGVGIRILIGKKPLKKEVSQGNFAVFGGRNLDYANQYVPALRIGAVFGGVKCRMTEAEIGPEGKLFAFCLFGGADIYVPEGVNVKTQVLSVFGGVSDKREEKNSDLNARTLYINGICVFGGIDIK